MWHKNAQLHVSRDGECYADHAKFGIQSQVLTYYFDLETLFVISMLSTPVTGIIIILSYLHTKHMIPLKIISPLIIHQAKTTLNLSLSQPFTSQYWYIDFQKFQDALQPLLYYCGHIGCYIVMLVFSKR